MGLYSFVWIGRGHSGLIRFIPEFSIVTEGSEGVARLVEIG